MTGIYKITNRSSGRFYIGSAIDCQQRWHTHLHLLRRGRHPNPMLMAVFKSAGEAGLAFEVVEVIERLTDLIVAEQRHIDTAIAAGHAIYNIRLLAGSQLGFRHSAESRAKMSAARIGVKRGPRSPEVIARVSRSLIGRKGTRLGKHLSAETRRKISQARIGMKCGPRSEATKRKISESRKGIIPWNKGLKMEAAK